MRGRPILRHYSEDNYRLGRSASVRGAIIAWLGVLAVALVAGRNSTAAMADEIVIDLDPISISSTTGEKPQSKVWRHMGRWWAVLPSTSFSHSADSGSWLWRLEANASWTSVLRLSGNTTARADAIAVGDVTHILLYDASETKLVSIEYDQAIDNYDFWSVRPTATPIGLSGSETATIDIDSTSRMWLATESGSNVLAYYSDFPYASFLGPVIVAGNIASDDISVVTALPNGTIGVLWSNQNFEQFGFRVHEDGVLPTLWLPDEVPAAEGSSNGVADDHLNVAVASDSTLYAAVKTSYDTSGYPQIALLVRRPDPTGPGGTWDDLYEVDESGTRGIVLLNEEAGTLRVVYTETNGGGDIVFRESPIFPGISFAPRQTLMSGTLNNVTSTKMNWTDEVLILASRSSYAEGVLIMRDATTTTTNASSTTTTPTTSTTVSLSSSTTTAAPSTSTTVVSPTSTTTLHSVTTTTTPAVTTTSTTPLPSTSTTTTTLGGAPTVVEIRIAASSDDAEEQAGGGVNLTSGDLELVFDKTSQTVGMRFNGVPIPKGARIDHAHVQFQVDETATVATRLEIRGEAIDNAPTFTGASRNISSRTRTAAVAVWSPEAWTTVGGAGPVQQTPELRSIIAEIVGREGWRSGNSVVIVVNGTGERVAKAYDGGSRGTPLLHVQYAPAGGTPTTTLSTSTTSTAASTTTTSTGVPPAQGLGVVVADACTREERPTRNYNEDELTVDGDSAKNTFIRINVSGVGGATVHRVLLHLTVADSSNAASDHGGRVHPTSCSWEEARITWNGQPTMGNVIDQHTTQVSPGDRVTFDLTGHCTGDGDCCVAITSPSGDGVHYDSRETAGGPTVDVVLAP